MLKELHKTDDWLIVLYIDMYIVCSIMVLDNPYVPPGYGLIRSIKIRFWIIQISNRYLSGFLLRISFPAPLVLIFLDHTN